MTADPPSNPADAVDDHDLHGFVDGRLPRERFADVIAALAADPARREQVADWVAARTALRDLQARLDPGPLPASMRRVLRAPGRDGTPRWAIAASIAAALVVGGLAGSLAGAGRLVGGEDPASTLGLARGTPAFVREAATAHVVFTPEKRHPVEVAGADEAHLVQWLSRRLGQPLRAPDLNASGWRLLGGRLLPGAPSPRAQFMYEDASGRRVTLFVTVFAEGQAPAETSFRSVRAGSRESFYWVEGRFGYALSAELPSADLQVLAREVWRQLDG